MVVISAITRLIKIRGRSARRKDALRHNNSFNSSGNSSDVIRKIGCLFRYFLPG